MLYEPLGTFGLGYRTLTSMYNQTAAAVFDYSQAMLADQLQPVDDDQLIANDVTVSRTNGSSYEAMQLTGALSVNPPPNGVGGYPKSFTVNCELDSQIPSIAGWLLNLGTVDQHRYPVVDIDLARPQVTGEFTAVIDTDLGDLITISNPPAWLPPETILQLVYGYTETIDTIFHWTFNYNCVPAKPYFVATSDDPTYDRVDTDGSLLVANINSSATTFQVNPADSSYPLWTTDSTVMPFDIVMDGERMTVKAISSTTSPQTFTVVRSVNGVVKSHTAGASLSLFYQAIVGL